MEEVTHRQIELAQYVAGEFFGVSTKVTGVRSGDQPLTAIIRFEDGSERSLNGKLAVAILSASPPPSA